MRRARLEALANLLAQRPILGPAFEGRADPLPHFAPELKQDATRAFEEVVGLPWLRGRGEHPVRTLWSREDWLAALEIFNLGVLIRRINSQASAAWWQAARKNLRSANAGDRAGAAFEIVAAGMLQSHGQTVRLAEPSQAGYDLTLQARGGGALRISCKSLTVSDEQRKFVDFADRLRDFVAMGVAPGAPIEVGVVLGEHRDPKVFDMGAVARGVQECIRRQRVCSDNSVHTVHDWTVVVRPVAPFGQAKFDQDEASYSFWAVQRHSRNEERRLEGKLEKAIDGLGRHCSAVSPRLANAVLIKLPEWISDADAHAYVQRRLATDCRHVSAVMLFRAQVMSGRSLESVRASLEQPIEGPNQRHHRERTGASIGFMVHVIENPRATVPFSTIAPQSLGMDIPAGHPIDGRLELHFDNGVNQMPVDRAYTYWRAQHSYRTDVTEETREARLQTFVMAGLSIRWRFFFRGAPISPLTEVPSCPHDELVLL